MREIKFRAWNKLDKLFHYYVEITIYKDGSVGVTAGENNSFPIGNTEDFILEQYTGLRDKNGVEIYEGDICLNMSDEKIEIKYEYGSWSWQYYEDPELFFEIIGNIHE